MHSGSFGCLTKLDAKRAAVVQKFVPRNRVGIFRNERIQSTPLDPNMMFWCVSYYLGVFGTVCLSYKTRGKTGRTSAKVRATKSSWIFLRRTHPIHPIGPKLMFWCVSYRLGVFATIWLPYKTRGKTFRTSAKVHDTKSRRNISRRTHPIHPIGP